VIYLGMNGVKTIPNIRKKMSAIVHMLQSNIILNNCSKRSPKEPNHIWGRILPEKTFRKPQSPQNLQFLSPAGSSCDGRCSSSSIDGY
jgi:hypothetical protein